jgi:hypothetical protein
MTGFDPEPDTRKVEADSASRCNAMALALVAARPDWQGLRLRVGGAHVRTAGGETTGAVSLESVLDLIEKLDERESTGLRLHALCDGICFESIAVAGEVHSPNCSGVPARNGFSNTVRSGAEIQ